MINRIGWGVFIGDESDASNIDAIKDSKITTILDLRELSIDVNIDEDSIKQVQSFVNQLENLCAKGYNILVHCHAGIDRAPFVVALWLSKNFNCTFQEAYDFVKEKRPQTIQHFEWYSQLTNKEDSE